MTLPIPLVNEPPLSPNLGLANTPTSDNAESLLVDIRALARLLTRSVGSLERDLSRGLLPKPIRLGGSRKWRRAEIAAWVEAGCPAQEEWEKRNQN
jgi:predicted DNA-binding transcriptional regulator AlpA